MVPVTQKKLMSPAMKRNISHEPISARVRWLFVNTMLTIRKTVNRINWKSCNPEILSINLIFLKPETKFSKFFQITQLCSKKLCSQVHFFLNRSKIAIELYSEKIKLKFCEIEFLALFCTP